MYYQYWYHLIGKNVYQYWYHLIRYNLQIIHQYVYNFLRQFFTSIGTIC